MQISEGVLRRIEPVNFGPAPPVWSMSALPPIGDMCGATRDVRFGPKADISRGERLLRSDLFEVGQFPFFVEQIFGRSIDQHELANGASILGHSIARQFAQQCLR
jgi:hypothetical protein